MPKKELHPEALRFRSLPLSDSANLAEETVSCTEHDAKSNQPEDRCTDTEVHQVFMMIILRFCFCEFLFDIALAPEFKAEVAADDKVDYYTIDVTEEMVDNQVKLIRSVTVSTKR